MWMHPLRQHPGGIRHIRLSSVSQNFKVVQHSQFQSPMRWHPVPYYRWDDVSSYQPFDRRSTVSATYHILLPMAIPILLWIAGQSYADLTERIAWRTFTLFDHPGHKDNDDRGGKLPSQALIVFASREFYRQWSPGSDVEIIVDPDNSVCRHLCRTLLMDLCQRLPSA